MDIHKYVYLFLCFLFCNLMHTTEMWMKLDDSAMNIASLVPP